MRTILLAGIAFAALTLGPAHAQFSDNLIKIGVLADRSGIYSDINGEGSVVAARLAAEEFGNKVAGAPIEIITGGPPEQGRYRREPGPRLDRYRQGRRRR